MIGLGQAQAGQQGADFQLPGAHAYLEVVVPVFCAGWGMPVPGGASAGADLLVVGSRGHGGFTEALLGSVSQHCVQHARCPVVVIRGRD